jgi:hypothetical protein
MPDSVVKPTPGKALFDIFAGDILLDCSENTDGTIAIHPAQPLATAPTEDLVVVLGAEYGKDIKRMLKLCAEGLISRCVSADAAECAWRMLRHQLLTPYYALGLGDRKLHIATPIAV